ncbi:hypothetical protein LCGC14_2189170, partial [marine sediment metagenome]
HGNVQLSGTGALADLLTDIIKRNTDIKRVRGDTFGYLQRSFAGYASAVDQREARLAGRKAVEYAVSGAVQGSVAFRRKRTGSYAVECFRADLHRVARVTKHMPRRYINKAGNGVTRAFINYAGPLVGELPVMGKLS